MISATLVHDTGTMIRFRTSQLDDLPEVTRDVRLILPTGRIVDAKFLYNRANPNVSGKDLVRYIKNRIPFGEREAVLIELRTAHHWVVHLVADAALIASDAGVSAQQIENGSIEAGELSAILRLADNEAERGRRLQTYRRILRPSGLRRLFVQLVGPECQVDLCGSCEHFDSHWGEGSGGMIVEVHHIENVARVIDHHPRNLCVLCANHHRFIHGAGPWRVEHAGADVILSRAGREMLINRPERLFSPAGSVTDNA